MTTIIDRIKTSCTVATSNCECFEKLTEVQKELVEQNQVTIQYKKGEIIAKQGTFTNHILVICEGLAKVYYEDKDDKLILRISGPGSLIGLTSLQEQFNTFQYTASAYVDTVVKLVDIKIIKRLAAENADFTLALMEVLIEIAVQKNQRFYCLNHRQSYGKLADILLCLAGNIFKTTKFELLLSRKELAELSGMSTESVIRTLKLFQNDGLIKISGKTFEIADPEGLYKVCQLG